MSWDLSPEDEARVVRVGSATGECYASNRRGWQPRAADRSRSAARYMSPLVCGACPYRGNCCRRMDDPAAAEALGREMVQLLVPTQERDR